MKALYWMLLWLMVLQGCMGTKFLEDNKKFYTGSDLNLIDKNNVYSRRSLLKDLKLAVKPRPNEKILGMRPAVWIYGISGVPRKKGLRHFVRMKLGKAPVLYETSIKESTVKLLKNRLFNHGYFNAAVEGISHEDENEVFMEYNITLGKPYVVHNILLPEDTSMVTNEVLAIASESLVKIGDRYNLAMLKKDRERISEHLKNKGFYYFNPEYITYEIDSTLGNSKVDITLKINDELPPSSLRKYFVNNVTVYPNYTIKQDSLIQLTTPETIHNVDFKDPKNRFRHEILEPLIFVRPGEPYHLNYVNLTMKRLSNLSTFSHSNIRFHKADTGQNLLDTEIFLTPHLRRSLHLEIEAASKSNNYVGPAINLDFRNNNRWRGAELFSVKMSAGIESQIAGKSKAVNSFELGIEASATFPRLLSLFRFSVSQQSDIPKTKIRLANNYLQRAGFYRINKTKLNFGYTWSQSSQKSHKLNLMDLNYVFTGSTSDEFETLLRDNITLRQSFEDQFILGGNYAYTYTNILESKSDNHLYFNINFDLSGNLINLVENAFSSNEFDDNELFGLPYAQYIRSDIDLRYFYEIGDNKTLASRMVVGLGYPYGNSNQLPFVKQFFIGGSSSIRAFQARGLGPGSYHSRNDSLLFVDQSGDLKLEANLEFRTHIYGIFKGAFFIDAGNVWLVNEDVNRQGGIFEPDRFLHQIGVGTGIGLRMDFTFFVLRFDWAFPLKKPYLDQGGTWVIDEIDFSSRRWRQDNLVFNFAIGYPF